MRELYPSKEAVGAAMASGEKAYLGETFEQPDELLVIWAPASDGHDVVVQPGSTRGQPGGPRKRIVRGRGAGLI
jgi:hypothetical protein